MIGLDIVFCLFIKIWARIFVIVDFLFTEYSKYSTIINCINRIPTLRHKIDNFKGWHEMKWLNLIWINGIAIIDVTGVE